MEYSKFLCAINGNDLESRSESKGVYFTKPDLVAYYEKNYDMLEPAKKIFYFKKPKPEAYPLYLNDGYHRYIGWHSSSLDKSTWLDSCLKYAISSESKVSAENVEKIKIFTLRGTLADLMEIYYQKKYLECKVRVTRYNGNLYMIREKDYGNKLRPHDTHDDQFRRNVFTESFCCEPNINEPCDPNKRLIGVHRRSFGEFDIIYSGSVYGIQADDEFKDFDNLKALNACRFVMAKQMWRFTKKDYQKYLHYWLEGYLLNATDIYFAYKDSDGIVREPIVHKRVTDLPKQFKTHCKPRVCTEFLYMFLQNVNKLMSNDNINDLKTVYEFNIDIQARIITYEIFKDNPEMFLFPPAYMEYYSIELLKH